MRVIRKPKFRESGIVRIVAIGLVITASIIGDVSYNLSQSSSAATATFGTSTIGSALAIAPNWGVSSASSPTNSGQVTSISFYIDGKGASSGSTTLGVGLYSDSNGKPNTLLGSAPIQTVWAGQSAKWMVFTLSSPVNVTAGTKYWIALAAGGSSSAARFYSGSIANADAYDQTAGSTLGSTFSMYGYGTMNGPVSAYATYTPNTAASFTLNSLNATVNDTSVTATANVSANMGVTASNYGICARDANGNNVDFGTNTNVAMTTSGVTTTISKTYAAGTYTYFACVNYNGTWTNLGSQSFTVTGDGSTLGSSVQPTGVFNGGSWGLKFDDEFNGTSLSTDNWSTDDGWTTNNVTVSSSNVTISAGNLNLTLASSTSGAEVDSNPADGAGTGYMLPVGGFAEARIDFPGSGTTIYNWPAWWASGPNWPAAGENDIAEGLGTLTVNYHSPSGAHNQGTIPGVWSNSFHTFGIYRAATESYVYYDGVQVASYPTDDNGQPEALLINIGNGNQGVYGAASAVKVDYVRAWQ